MQGALRIDLKGPNLWATADGPNVGLLLEAQIGRSFVPC
jgi:hypothetical protein